MDNQEIINRIIEDADKLFQQKKYNEAYHSYEQSFPLISSLNIKSKRANSIGSITGWTAGLITGGLGIEDIFIIPIVSKVISTKLGSDENFVSAALSSTLLRQIYCLINSNSLIRYLEKKSVIQKFALLISSVNDDKIYHKISKLYFPDNFTESILDNADAILNPEYYLLDQLNYIQSKSEEIFYLLHIYLQKIGNQSELNSRLFSTFDNSKERSQQNNNDINTDYKDDSYYYEILGLREGATNEEIKKAYYDLMKKYHPDNFDTLSDEYKELAKRKAQLINEAYSYLMKK